MSRAALRRLGAALLAAGLLTGPARAADTPAGTVTVSAIAEFGAPAYPPGFKHFNYVNPDAPKGGSIVLAEQGTFDSLNPIILRGVTPGTIGLTQDALMAPSADELNVAYSLVAKTVTYPADKSWAVFDLRPEARWQDGQPLTSADFVYAWKEIQAVGNPFLKSFLVDVSNVTAEGPYRLKATFRTTGSMKPMLAVATILTPLPQHWWTAPGHDISQTTLTPAPGSGPYKIAKVDPGRSITYVRDPNYWGRDLPVNVGQNNFDSIRYDYYRDDDVMFEAFKAGAYDLRQEIRAQRWVAGYRDLPAVKQGFVETRALPNNRPIGAQGILWNTRRPQFSDRRVREGLAYLFDFSWIQKTILYGQYARTESNFPNSDYGASGPPTAEEKAILAPYAKDLPPEVMTRAFVPPNTAPNSDIRTSLRKAEALFTQAGWVVRGGRLVNGRTGQPMTIEFLDNTQSMVRVLQPYVQMLRRAGISATIRIVDTAQYQRRLDDFDFDAIVVNFNFFPPPGNELWSYFGSKAADQKGAANFSGIHDPVVDALIGKIVKTEDLATLKATSRALDRVLLWGWYMVPQWYQNQTWFAYWTKFGRPEVQPKYDTGFPATWWYDPAKAARIKR